MKSTALILALASLTGCATARDMWDRHPILTTFLVTSAVLTVKHITDGNGGHHHDAPEHDVNAPRDPRCDIVPDACK